MNDWEELNSERIALERELLCAERESQQHQDKTWPDSTLANSAAERIEGCLARLRFVNDRLARLARPTN
ncbi:hypothetical protein [Azohydromonas aeria]|uniref:hypothetical protein n=1 Tax=Azohydromonas aeria TaxID=2590212 RepID=UPI0012FC3566|nr:hypothetical protein [Azohydromonas aeria]